MEKTILHSLNSYSVRRYYHSYKTSILLVIIALAGNVINFWLSFICMVLFFVNNRSINNKKGAVVLLSMIVCFGSYFYFAAQKADVSFHIALWRSVLPFLAFLIGRLIGSRVRAEDEIVFWWLTMAFALSLPNVPITLYDVFQNGIVNPDRYLSVIDVNEGQRSVAGRVMDLSLALSGASCLYFLKKSSNTLIRFWIVLFIMAFVSVLHYVSRTGIVLVGVSSVIGLLFVKKNMFTKFVLVLFLAGLFYYIQDSSLFHVYSAREIEGSSFADAGDRLPRWILGFQMLMENPQGYVMVNFYAHNFWLDYGKNGGLLAAVSLFIVCVYVLIKSLRIYFANKKYSSFFRCFILSSTVVVFLAAFTEPIHAGAPAFMWAYMMICGVFSVIPNDGLNKFAN